MCSNSGETVQYQLMMRILGGFALIFGIIEIVIGFIIYVFFTDLHLGGWWGAILTVISGALALSSANRGIVTGVCITGSIGIVIAIIASIVDGIASVVFKNFTACCNGDYQCSGSSGGKACAAACVDYSYGSENGSQCFCTDGSSVTGSYTCWHYELTSGTDCNKVLTTYANELSASTAFLSFGAITLTILSITTCSALCCAKPPTVLQAPLNPTGAPVVIVSPLASAPTAPNVYGQPQYGQQPQVAYVVDSKY